jgi:hypothetical protein
MNTVNLLAECKAQNIELLARGGQLHIDAPAGVMTNELLQRLRDAKPELLLILATPAPPAPIDLDLEQVFTVTIDSPGAIADFCLLLTVDDLPPVPFRLNAWTEVRDGSKMLQSLRSDILRGLSGPSVNLGALHAKLLALKQAVMLAAENNPITSILAQ